MRCLGVAELEQLQDVTTPERRVYSWLAYQALGLFRAFLKFFQLAQPGLPCANGFLEKMCYMRDLTIGFEVQLLPIPNDGSLREKWIQEYSYLRHKPAQIFDQCIIKGIIRVYAEL